MPPKLAALFRTLIAKALYVSCRSRPDWKTALSFLTTRVKNPTRDDYEKLVCDSSATSARPGVSS